MQRPVETVTALMVGIVMISMAAQAHHSTAAFDYSKVLTLQGTVKRFEWTSPHTHIIVVPDGQSSDIRLEVGTIAINARDGWSQRVVNAGDKLTITYSPMKDGTPGGTLRTAKLPSGQVLKGGAAAFGGGPPAGAPPSQSDNPGAAATSPEPRPGG